jgi:hypothetical protein
MNHSKAAQLLAAWSAGGHHRYTLSCLAGKQTGLDALLILPVQRLPRYVLFLNEMSKKSSGDAVLSALVQDGKYFLSLSFLVLGLIFSVLCRACFWLRCE